jgi:fucose 4-O-acetylase-like acetyltransferase
MSKNITRKSRRIETIDIAKAITIFCVILGHTTGNLDTPMFRRVLYAFHMPLFFFLAGLSIKPKAVHGFKGWRMFLHKNILALMAPYLVWGLVYAPFSYTNMGALFYGSWEALTRMETLTSLWYLPCFFISRVFVQIAVNIAEYAKVKNMPFWCGIAALPLLVAGLFIPHGENGVVWCADIALAAAGFILLGVAVRKSYLVMAQQKTLWLILAFIGSLLLFCVGTVFRGEGLELSLMCKSDYGNQWWFLYNSVFGSLTVLTVSMLLSRLSRESARPFKIGAVTYIGRQTMGIYLLHKPFLQQIILPALSGSFPGNFPFFVIALIGSVLAMLFSIAMCYIVGKFIPQLLGRFPRNEWAKDREKHS